MWNTRVNESSASRPDSSIVILQIGLDEYFTTFDPRVSVRGTPEARVFWGLIHACFVLEGKKAMFDARQSLLDISEKFYAARKIVAHVKRKAPVVRIQAQAFPKVQTLIICKSWKLQPELPSD